MFYSISKQYFNFCKIEKKGYFLVINGLSCLKIYLDKMIIREFQNDDLRNFSKVK